MREECYGRKSRKSGLQLAVGSGDGARWCLITISESLIVLGYSRTGTCFFCLHFFSHLYCLPLSFPFLCGHGLT